MPPEPGPLVKNSASLHLWAVQTISVFGSQFTLLALPIVAVLALHASPGQMGILAAVQAAPFLLLGLVAGVWVDRIPRRAGESLQNVVERSVSGHTLAMGVSLP